MIYIAGDTHGDFGRFEQTNFVGFENDYVIICGDFGGIWNGSEEEQRKLDRLSEKPVTILFIDGNHENYDLLNSYPVTEWNGGKVHKIRDNVIHLMRGQVFRINGIRFFTMGGAVSHDIGGGILEPNAPDYSEKKERLDKERALYRVNHISWWEQEFPSEKELEEGIANLEKHNYKVDCILTHCAPTSVQEMFGTEFYKNDRLTDYLEKLLNRCEFKYWFFGHYHENEMISDKMVLLYDSILPLRCKAVSKDSYRPQN